MSWWIYENWRAGKHKAVIHTGDCRFCNEGKGMSDGEADPRNGRWHGSYTTFEEAVERQETLQVVTRQQCSVCI